MVELVRTQCSGKCRTPGAEGKRCGSVATWAPGKPWYCGHHADQDPTGRSRRNATQRRVEKERERRELELQKRRYERLRQQRRRNREKSDDHETIALARWDRIERNVATVGRAKDERQWTDGWYSWQEPGDVIPGYHDD